MTSNKATKQMQLSRNHRPTKTTGGPTVRSSIDAGLNLAGGAQKLSGPHRTRRKKPSRNKQKEPPRNHEEHLKNLLTKIYSSEAVFACLFLFTIYTFPQTALLLKALRWLLLQISNDAVSLWTIDWRNEIGSSWTNDPTSKFWGKKRQLWRFVSVSALRF